MVEPELSPEAAAYLDDLRRLPYAEFQEKRALREVNELRERARSNGDRLRGILRGPRRKA